MFGNHPLKILHIANEDPSSPTGGLGTHVLGLSTNQAALGHDVKVCGVDAFGKPGRRWNVDLNGNKVEATSWGHIPGQCQMFSVENTSEFNANVGAFNDIIRDMIFNDNLSYLISKVGWKPDVIHMHDCVLYKPVRAVLNWNPDTRLFVSSHLAMTAVNYQAWDKFGSARHYAEQELMAFNHAKHVITVSKFYEEHIRNTLFIDNVTMIPNGVETSHIPFIDPAQESKFVVGFIGRPVLQKGVDFIIDAAKVFPEVEFRIVAGMPKGFDMPWDPIVRLLEKAPPNIIWDRESDYFGKWKHFINGVDLAVMPSRHEPFGIVALEWMAAGVPIAVPRSGGLAEFCDDSNSIPMRPSTSGMIECIKRFWDGKYKNPAISKTVQGGYNTANRYSWKNVAEQTLEIYGKYSA